MCILFSLCHVLFLRLYKRSLGLRSLAEKHQGNTKMPIDYSKWDKIELSDDSDVEVHPNVDKNSFIRWKQQDIHQKREERKLEIKTLEQQLNMYEHLNKRVDYLLKLKDPSLFVDAERLETTLNQNFDKLEKCEGDRIDKDIPPYNEMVSDLFEQFMNELKKEGPQSITPEAMLMKIIQHRSKIEQVTRESTEKLATLYKERELHISSEDMHDGWNSGFLNKQKPEENAVVKKAEKGPVTPGDLGIKHFISYDDEEDVLKLHPLTLEFGSISEHDLEKSERFLLEHFDIISAQQTDALMMSSFNHELEANTDLTRRAIFQSEILSSVSQIYQMKFKGNSSDYIHVNELQDIIKKFFFKLREKEGNNMAKDFFEKEVETKYAHVKKRAVVMNEEKEETVETIQLRSMDPDSKLVINLPDFNSQDAEEQQRTALFNEIPQELREALLTGELDAVNKEFEKMTVEEGEHMLEIFNAGAFLGIQQLFENSEEFEAYKKELAAAEKQEEGEKEVNKVEELD